MLCCSSIVLFSLVHLTSGKSISIWNRTTTIVHETSSFPTLITSTKATIIRNTRMPMNFDKETTTIAANITDDTKFYEFQSNYSRNNDSVFVSTHVNGFDSFISINNTFTNNICGDYPCEILLNEYSMNLNRTLTTNIVIGFNQTLTRNLAIQLGERLIDLADLLLTLRSMAILNETTNTVH